MNIKVLAQGALNLAIKRCTGSFWYRSRWLNETQWCSRAELEQIQLRLLKKLIAHAYNTVPYYCQRMTSLHIKPNDLNSLEDIKKFPILDKQDVLSAGKSMHSTKFPKILTRIAYTGGTTGVRVPLLRDLWSIGNEHAFVRRQYDWANLSSLDVCAILSWRIVCPPGQTTNRPYRYDPVMRELVLSTFHLTPEMIPVYLDSLMKYKVSALVGYPSAISTIARYCIQNNAKLKMKAVLTTSENLDTFQKNQITEAFSCPVFDHYGGSERVCYIHMCPSGSYHILSEYGVTELLDVPEKPEFKKIVATGFWNRAMPLIRYDTGDLVILGKKKCDCGREYPLVEKIIGRQAQIIKTPSGKELGPTAIECIMEFILHDLKSFPVAEAQMVMDETFHLVLQYISTRTLTDHEENKINQLIKYHIPEDFSIELRRVSVIQKTVSGKQLSLVFNSTTKNCSQ